MSEPEVIKSSWMQRKHKIEFDWTDIWPVQPGESGKAECRMLKEQEKADKMGYVFRVVDRVDIVVYQ